MAKARYPTFPEKKTTLFCAKQNRRKNPRNRGSDARGKKFPGNLIFPLD